MYVVGSIGLGDYSTIIGNNVTIGSIYMHNASAMMSNNTYVDGPVWLSDESLLSGVNITINYLELDDDAIFIGVDVNITSMYFSGGTALINGGTVPYYMSIYDGYAELYNLNFTKLYIEQGFVYLENVSLEYASTFNGTLIGTNVNVSMVDISDLLGAGFSGENTGAYLALYNSTVSEYYGAHYLMTEPGCAEFDNGTIHDPDGIVVELSVYENTDTSAARELATFYIAGFSNVTIANYTQENNREIVSLYAFRAIDHESPEITASHNTLEFEIGMTPPDVTWTITDRYPATYEIYLNGTLIDSRPYTSGQTITFETATEITEAGTYNLTIVAYDEAGNEASKTTWITAYPSEPPEITLSPEDTYTIYTDEFILLNWSATDRFPGQYVITVNNSEVQSGSWERGSIIQYNFSAMEPGTYVIKITFMDAAGHSTDHIVTIHVESRPAPGPAGIPITPEIAIVLALSGIGVIVIIAIVIPRIRRR